MTIDKLITIEAQFMRYIRSLYNYVFGHLYIAFRSLALSKRTSWASIGRLGKHKSLRLSYLAFILIPIAVQLVDLMPIKLTIPFSWLSVYFASIFVGLAQLIYDFRNPEFLSKYPNLSSFQNEKEPVETALDAIALHIISEYSNVFRTADTVRILNQHFAKAHSMSMDDLEEVFQPGLQFNLPEEGWKRVFDLTATERQTLSYQLASRVLNYSYKYSRLAALSLYLIGFTCLAFVILQKFYHVTGYLLKKQAPTIYTSLVELIKTIEDVWTLFVP